MKTTDPSVPLELYISCLKTMLQQTVVGGDQEMVIELRDFKDRHTLYFKVSMPDRQFLVKVTERAMNSDMTASVLGFLHARGLNVIPFIGSGLGITVNGHYLNVCVSSYMKSRGYSSSDPRDFSGFLQVIEPIHRALAQFPHQDRIKEKALQYTDLLLETRDRIRFFLGRPMDKGFGGFAEWLRTNSAFLDRSMDGLDLRMQDLDDAQCLHGDLHPGNLLFPGTGLPFLIDFDACEKLFAPVAYDIAYILFRFCILESPGDRKGFREKAAMLSDVYGQQMPPLPELFRLIQTIALKLILMVVSSHVNEGVTAPVSELEKFKCHYLFIEKSRHLLL